MGWLLQLPAPLVASGLVVLVVLILLIVPVFVQATAFVIALVAGMRLSPILVIRRLRLATRWKTGANSASPPPVGSVPASKIIAQSGGDRGPVMAERDKSIPAGRVQRAPGALSRNAAREVTFQPDLGASSRQSPSDETLMVERRLRRRRALSWAPVAGLFLLLELPLLPVMIGALVTGLITAACLLGRRPGHRPRRSA